jgi:hypothetical protein
VDVAPAPVALGSSDVTLNNLALNSSRKNCSMRRGKFVALRNNFRILYAVYIIFVYHNFVFVFLLPYMYYVFIHFQRLYFTCLNLLDGLWYHILFVTEYSKIPTLATAQKKARM